MTKSKSCKFDVGDMAVYPAHGVGKIEAIETREVGELQQAFYVIRIVDTNMVIMIPTASSEHVGLRSIIKSDEVEGVYSILQQKGVAIMARPWNQRYREYMEKIKSGSVKEIAEVLRDLYTLREDKTLSFGERKMMDTAQGLLIKEIALADQINEDTVEERINHIFA
ncbi:MAG: CarD family transcriptional regulator [Deltaproteobacteria bacterium]|nr:CarD family transcriptional regulator [Deltaproteobacteria bacterium]